MAAKKTCFVVEHGGRIYGAGNSRNSAMKNASEWLGGDSRGVELVPATSALCRFVRKHGYDDSRVSWPAGSGRSKAGLRRKSRR